MKLFKEIARKPIERKKIAIKYGFIVTEYQYMDCPRCGEVLNAGPDYQPNYCERCGQRISFEGVKWKEKKSWGI